MGLNNLNQDFQGNHSWWKTHAKLIFIVALLLSLLVLVAASVDMARVAFSSQPDCVPHSQSKSEVTIQHRAAKSSC